MLIAFLFGHYALRKEHTIICGLPGHKILFYIVLYAANVLKNYIEY